MIIGKSGCGNTTSLINLLLRPGWLDYNNINIFGKSLFQPEYHILKKASEEKLPKEVIIRLFQNQNEITDLGISPISVVEEMAKDIRDKSDVECKFYESAEDVPDPRELRSGKKNLIVFDDRYLKNKSHVNRIMLEEDIATLIVSIYLKTISSCRVKQSERTRTSFVCFHKT